MRLKVLRPVGEWLPSLRQAPLVEQLLPPGYDMVFTQSGTAALALALRLAAARAGPGRRRVLLPAYGCPDLVAAVCFNGLEAELVDTATDSPFMCLERLRARLGDDVLAVVGVHFLGLAQDIAGIHAACRDHDIVVIEDSAQRIPGAGDVAPVAELVIMSFGRGKPAGALGGGALLFPGEQRHALLDDFSPEPAKSRRVPAWLMRQIYNLAIRPPIYGLVSRMPGLDLGATRYKPLADIRQLDQGREQGARSGWRAAREAPLGKQSMYLRIVENAVGFMNLPVVHAQGHRVPLTRFPLLVADPRRRDKLVWELNRQGLGASAMYGKSLPELQGVPAIHAPRSGRARSFGSRLLTLPLHEDVTAIDFQRIEELLNSSARS